jgi:2-hydroxycyclohexanecarboxyl-CoA dehydrogenase
MSEQRVAIVTGAASGIGLAISRRLARDGHAVAVLDVDGDAAAAAAQVIGNDDGRAIGVAADVAERQHVRAAVEWVRHELGPPSILVNNAGTGSTFTRFLKVTPEEWDRVLGVNLTGAFHCCQAVLPDMVEVGWGRIVNISSSSTHSGQPLLGPYVSSKSGSTG